MAGGPRRAQGGRRTRFGAMDPGVFGGGVDIVGDDQTQSLMVSVSPCRLTDNRNAVSGHLFQSRRSADEPATSCAPRSLRFPSRPYDRQESIPTNRADCRFPSVKLTDTFGRRDTLRTPLLRGVNLELEDVFPARARARGRAPSSRRERRRPEGPAPRNHRTGSIEAVAWFNGGLFNGGGALPLDRRSTRRSSGRCSSAASIPTSAPSSASTTPTGTRSRPNS